MKYAIVSGYFDPLHVGHLSYMREAKKLGEKLIVIVNNDEQAKMKKGEPFMTIEERMEILRAIKFVDIVVPSIDKDRTVIETLKKVVNDFKPADFVFANGGDQEPGGPEEELCKEINIEFVYDVGGEKVQSSSWLIKRAKDKNNQ